MVTHEIHKPFQSVETINPDGVGPALILCEHASNHIPPEFGELGLIPDALNSHAAWDPGARAVALGLSAALNAPLVAGCVSRLVYDCNRPPEADTAIPARSEIFDVPGNTNLTVAEKMCRIETVYDPFCTAVENVIAARQVAGRQTVLITIHSFTPVYFEEHRDVEIGILHDRDSRLADAMLDMSHRLPHRRIDRNQPYGPDDGVTHSLKLHGISNALPNVMIEIRNDLLTSEVREVAMASELLELIAPALSTLGLTGEGEDHA